jgi:zinc transporter ZupT
MNDFPPDVTEKHPTGRRKRLLRLLAVLPVVLGVFPLSFLVLLAAGETSVSGTAVSVALAVLLGVVGLVTYLSVRLAGMRRRRALLIAFLAAPASFVLTLLILWLLVTVQAGPSPQESNAACVKQKHLPAYTAYNLGAKFDGLPLTSVQRSCQTSRPRARARH